MSLSHHFLPLGYYLCGTRFRKERPWYAGETPSIRGVSDFLLIYRGVIFYCESGLRSVRQFKRSGRPGHNNFIPPYENPSIQTSEFLKRKSNRMKQNPNACTMSRSMNFVNSKIAELKHENALRPAIKPLRQNSG